MWVDIDDVRKEIKNLEREDIKGLREETSVGIRATYSGILVGYKKVESMLNELEKVYRERESECVRGMKEVGNEE